MASPISPGRACSIPTTGQPSLSYLDRILPGHDIVVVRLAVREQGLLVAPGNPLGLGGISDLARAQARYMNRQPGSGTRALFDYELIRAGIAPSSIFGYEREGRHTWRSRPRSPRGARTAASGSLPPRVRSGSSFVPLRREPFDLVLNADSFLDPMLGPLWDLLSSVSFQASVRALGGYDTAEMGVRIR